MYYKTFYKGKFGIVSHFHPTLIFAGKAGRSPVRFLFNLSNV